MVRSLRDWRSFVMAVLLFKNGSPSFLDMVSWLLSITKCRENQFGIYLDGPYLARPDFIEKEIRLDDVAVAVVNWRTRRVARCRRTLGNRRLILC